MKKILLVLGVLILMSSTVFAGAGGGIKATAMDDMSKGVPFSAGDDVGGGMRVVIHADLDDMSLGVPVAISALDDMSKPVAPVYKLIETW